MLKVFMTMAKFVNYYETNFITLAKKMGLLLTLVVVNYNEKSFTKFGA
jgi:hypothetical protein